LFGWELPCFLEEYATDGIGRRCAGIGRERRYKDRIHLDRIARTIIADSTLIIVQKRFGNICGWSSVYKPDGRCPGKSSVSFSIVRIAYCAFPAAAISLCQAERKRPEKPTWPGVSALPTRSAGHLFCDRGKP
ncbi:hypothetical protein AB3332_21055, partial [Ralstonia solanacearum]|uniref:hypothetical protein n=1 Tax=Ralstonia solanacearum TaxID=305 RepID=UPI0034DCCFE0